MTDNNAQPKNILKICVDCKYYMLHKTRGNNHWCEHPHCQHIVTGLPQSCFDMRGRNSPCESEGKLFELNLNKTFTDAMKPNPVCNDCRFYLPGSSHNIGKCNHHLCKDLVTGNPENARYIRESQSGPCRQAGLLFEPLTTDNKISAAEPNHANLRD